MSGCFLTGYESRLLSITVGFSSAFFSSSLSMGFGLVLCIGLFWPGSDSYISISISLDFSACKSFFTSTSGFSSELLSEDEENFRFNFWPGSFSYSTMLVSTPGSVLTSEICFLSLLSPVSLPDCSLSEEELSLPLACLPGASVPNLFVGVSWIPRVLASGFSSSGLSTTILASKSVSSEVSASGSLSFFDASLSFEDEEDVDSFLSLLWPGSTSYESNSVSFLDWAGFSLSHWVTLSLSSREPGNVCFLFCPGSSSYETKSI